MRIYKTERDFRDTLYFGKHYKLQKEQPNLYSKEEMYETIIGTDTTKITDRNSFEKNINYSKLTPLLIELIMGDVHSVADLISKGYDYKEKYENDVNAAMVASYLKDHATANYLTEINTNFIYETTASGVDLLKTAVQSSDINLVSKILIDNPESINQLDENDLNALFYLNNEIFIPKITDDDFTTSYLKKLSPNDYITSRKNDLLILKKLLDNNIDVKCNEKVKNILSSILGTSRVINLPKNYTDNIVSLLIEAGASKEIIREGLTNYEMFGGIKEAFSDVVQLDFSGFIDLPSEISEYNAFKKLVKKHELSVTDKEGNSYTKTFDQGKKIK